MAVFPDRIVLKNSTDSSVDIANAIASGGTDPITQGEIVLGIEPGNAQIYTLDSNGNVITIATGSAAARAIVSADEPTVGIGGQPLAEGDLWFESDTGSFHVYSSSSWVEISGSGVGALTLGGLSDVNLSTSPVNNQVLTYRSSSNEWIAANNASIPTQFTGDLITSIDELPVRLGIGGEGQVLTVSASGTPVWADAAAVSVSQLSDLDDIDSTLAPSQGQVLVYNSTSGEWEAGSVAGTGTVTSVDLTAGSGIEITGGPITSAGSIGVSVAASGVVAGTYPAARINIGADGRIISASSSGLDDLSDVDTTTAAASDGDTLIWNSSLGEWRPGNITGAVTSIVAGTGVTISPTGGTGDVTINASLGGSIDQLDDVDTTTSTPVNGEVLAWDNANGVWVPAPPTVGAEVLDDLTDVNAGSPLDNQVLVWDNTASKWVPGDAGQGSVSSVDISGSNGITTAGGPITASGTINVSLDSTGVTPATYTNPTIGVNAQGRITSIADGWGDPTVTAGDMIYNNGSAAVRLPPGGNGEILQISGGIPTWAPAGGANGGTVTSVDITTSAGLSSSGGPITTSGSINVSLDDTGVSAGNYQNAFITINSKGQITAASNGTSISSIDDLTDVDTSTSAPVDGQALVWDQTTGQWVPGTAIGGGGGGSGAGLYMQEVQTSSASGEATFVGIGFSGVVQKVTANVDTWLVLYSSATARTNDASRAFSTDPSTGSGVVFEAYIAAGTTVVASPGTTYFNNDATATEAIYAAMRTQAGADIVSTVSISAYGMAAITAVNGGTFGSGV